MSNIISLKNSEEWAVEQSKINPGNIYQCLYYCEYGLVGRRRFVDGKVRITGISSKPSGEHWAKGFEWCFGDE